MLFNSYLFILIFLPIVLSGFHLLGKYNLKQSAIGWLVASSLFFYGWWNPAYLALIVSSMLFNYSLGGYLGRFHGGKYSRPLLIFGIIVNLGLIIYFKYANFFVDNYNVAFNQDFNLEKIILPLAISFFTFQQITYLVDAYKGETKEYNFLHYCLFVTFFPQLIAGPIVHHKDMLPQFMANKIYRLASSNLSIGISIFILGLFKKVVFADTMAGYATPVFNSAESEVALSGSEAWLGSLAYSFQLYFDFSGYSDMAIGLARMFGIILPINFYSPYKATNIIEFWRRWHITLSRFLRDYLYIPLGGNQKGKFRRYLNLFITMLLGGLWHGAGWPFIIWGAMHGIYLVINHGWINLSAPFLSDQIKEKTLYKMLARSLTLLVVVLAWVMFRAESLQGASNIYAAMFGLNEFHLVTLSDEIKNGFKLVILLLLIVWFTPNTFDWFRSESPALGLNSFNTKAGTRFTWSPKLICSVIISIIATVALMFVQQESEFLYFQF